MQEERQMSDNKVSAPTQQEHAKEDAATDRLQRAVMGETSDATSKPYRTQRPWRPNEKTLLWNLYVQRVL